MGHGTYIFAYDSSHTLDPTDAHPADFVDEQALAGENRFAERLALVVLRHALRARQESVLADVPGLAAGQTQLRDVS